MGRQHYKIKKKSTWAKLTTLCHIGVSFCITNLQNKFAYGRLGERYWESFCEMYVTTSWTPLTAVATFALIMISHIVIQLKQ